MAFSRVAWVKNKKNTSLRLANGECGGSYAEGVIILSAAISAMAADAWPGTGIDRKRFVEIIKEYCDKTLRPTSISMPLLIGYLRDSGKVIEAESLREKFMDFQRTRVLTGNEIDKNETDILSVCPGLALKEIRRLVYPAILYEDVRSSFVHDYRAGARADSWAMSEFDKTGISYVNWMDDPDRHIHFPVGWIGKVAESVAETADKNASKFPLATPVAWWLDG